MFDLSLLNIFNEQEFEWLVSGKDISIDIEDLRLNTNYVAGYSANSRYIRVR